MSSQDFPEEFKGLTDPFEIFSAWWNEAHESSLNDPNAFALATCDKNGQPHCRVVLAKELRDDEGLVFYTNYQSAKGQDIHQNPKVAATFFWDPIYKQVRITGSAQKTSRSESEKYWDSRPRSRQLSQWMSKQSESVSSREEMTAQLAEVEQKFSQKPIPCPPHWGGYIIQVHSMEFWVGHKDRFHDRIRFTKVENLWQHERLYP